MGLRISRIARHLRTAARLAALALPLAGGAGAAAAQEVRAVRIEGAAPRLDGRLDDAVWQAAAPATGFTQREPDEGTPAGDATEVRFAYDDAALWIGARMHSRDGAAIQSLVTRRDREGSSEQLVVSLDTYRDRRTAYTFAVTPAGVRIDYYHGSDFESSRDYGYDPVWEVRTATDAQGWTAEMRIPLNQLRFDPAAADWGVNLARLVPARNEESYWVLVRRDETGWSSRMGALAGIGGLRRPRRVELLPYVAADATFAHDVDPRDPFVQPREAGARVGGDVKVGLGSSLTLDVTLNPDFGQVEADPAEVNLTAFETFFDERRPFFAEGANLFGGRGFFYSRRIGAAPPGSAEADFVAPARSTTILGAAKVTGRLPSGLSIGTVAAVTDHETVETYDTVADVFGRVRVSPRTAYAVASVQQEFGATRSTVGAMVTTVQRDLAGGPELRALLPSSAYSAMLDGRLRWAGGKYDVSAFLGATHVRGSDEAIVGLQRSSRRFWQRPDMEGGRLDPDARTLSGTYLGINHSKLAGTHWLWDVDYWQESPGLEPNDLGSFGSVDDRGLSTNLRYRETRPGSWYRSYSVGLSHGTEWNFDGVRRFTLLNPYASVTLPNFWTLAVDGEFRGRGTSDDLTRGGPLMGTGRRWSGVAELTSRRGARTGWQAELSGLSTEVGSWQYRGELELELRPGPRWEFSVQPTWLRGAEARQYVTAADGGRAETFGRRYVFAHVERSEASVEMRLNYTFTPDLSLETYVEPFASSGRYHGFGELLAPRSRDLFVYGTGGSTVATAPDGTRTVTFADGGELTIAPRDFNVRSLRTNAVLRWEWRPGSTAYLVWQQDRGGSRDPGRVSPGSLWESFEAEGDQFLALKVSYWLPIR
jgi:hypothetical protein